MARTATTQNQAKDFAQHTVANMVENAQREIKSGMRMYGDMITDALELAYLPIGELSGIEILERGIQAQDMLRRVREAGTNYPALREGVNSAVSTLEGFILTCMINARDRMKA